VIDSWIGFSIVQLFARASIAESKAAQDSLHLISKTQFSRMRTSLTDAAHWGHYFTSALTSIGESTSEHLDGVSCVA
jgi:hypothetical protein